MKLKTPVLLYFSGLVLSRAVSFLLLPLLLNVLTKDEFAYYSLLVSVFLFASVFFQAGIPQIVSSLFNKSLGISKTETASLLFSISLIGGAVLLAVAIMVSAPLSKILFFNGERYTLSIIILFVGCYFENLIYFLLQLFKTEGQAVKVFYYTITQSVLTLIFSIYALFHSGNVLQHLMLSHTIAAMLVFVLLVFKEKIKPGPLTEFSRIRPTVLSLAFPLVISGIMTTMLDVFDRFLLNKSVSSSDLALYSFAYRLGIVMNLFVFAFRTGWLPYALNRLEQGKGTEGFGRIFNVLVAGMAVIGFFSNLLFPAFTGITIFDRSIIPEEYTAGFILVPVILAAYFFNGLASFYSVYSYRTEQGRDFLISDTLGAVVNIVGNILLIPLAGIMGSAIATIFGYISTALFMYYRSMPLPIIYEKKQLGLMLIATLFGIMLWTYDGSSETAVLSVTIVTVGSIPILLPSIRHFVKAEFFSKTQ